MSAITPIPDLSNKIIMLKDLYAYLSLTNDLFVVNIFRVAVTMDT